VTNFQSKKARNLIGITFKTCKKEFRLFKDLSLKVN